MVLGETIELRADLNNEDRDTRKETVKRVIAQMTVGKDVSSLFPDVLKNMQTDDIELKKLVYLYLMNYSKSQPELVILAVNTFIKDVDDPNPLIRALAIRTMSCIRVDKMLDFVSEPLNKCLRDDNPYVRKTAVIAVAKLYDLSPELAVENGFVATLLDMVADSNPSVVANAVAALMDINEVSLNGKVFHVTSVLVNKLLVALNECTEWGQIAVLSALAEYTPVDEKDAAQIVEKVIPRLQHANCSVVLSAIKVLLMYKKYVHDHDLHQLMLKKMAPPLVTLLATAPEIQFAALRNISLILQKEPTVLQSEIRVFFCRYNDPTYVKNEKLDILLRLASKDNFEQLLSELKEYTNEVDMDFVRRSIRAIGRCAIKIEESVDRCVQTLLDVVESQVTYVVQESIIVIKDILRKYPQQFDAILSIVTQNIEQFDSPESKASLIWIIGEYSHKIPHAADLLEQFMDTFKEDPVSVQLQIITAIVKFFLRQPDAGQDMVMRALDTATQQSTNPDLRDRAFIYWRLLSSDPQAAAAVVLATRPPIQEDERVITSQALLDRLVGMLGSVASVLHKPPEMFMGSGRFGAVIKPPLSIQQEEAVVSKETVGDLLDLGFDDAVTTSPPTLTKQVSMDVFGATASPPTSSKSMAMDDMLGIFDTVSAPSSQKQPQGDLLDFL